MDVSSLVTDSSAGSPTGVDNGLEMRPLSSDSHSPSAGSPAADKPGQQHPLTEVLVLNGAAPPRPGSPDFPGAPPSSPMQVTAPGGGFGENSETIQSEGVRNLVQELQQMSHAQRQLQIIHQQQLMQEQQQQQQLLEGHLPGGVSLSASGQQIYLGQNGVQAGGDTWPAGAPGPSVQPPDGGYGWVVVLGCFLCMVVVDGISFGFGILLSPIQETFEEGKGLVSLAGALTTGFYLLVGPLASALCSRFSYRQVTIFGSVLSAVSVLGASYVQELWLFILLYGVLGGTGFGVIYITCFSVVGAWFQNKRAFATGTVVCGTGIGLALIGVVGPLLIRAYSWRGALVVFSCLLAQGCVCGVLFRPTEVHQCIAHRNQARRARRELKRKTRAAEAQPSQRSAKANGGGTANGKGASPTGGSPSPTDAEKKKKRRPRKRAHQCSIMQKIIEDKERQRTTSSGSLNGCIITQDNQLIQPPEGYSDSPRFSQNALNRLVESVRRRTQGFPGLSRSRQSSMRQIVEAMPQMVADYVSQSQHQNQQQQVQAATQQQQQSVVVTAAAAAAAGGGKARDAGGSTHPLVLKPSGSSLPQSRAPSACTSRHNSAASLFHSVERMSGAGGAKDRGGGREAELQRPLLLQLEGVGGIHTATSSGAATPSITASSGATPAPTLVSLRTGAGRAGGAGGVRRSPAGSGSLHYSGSFAQLPPGTVQRPSSLMASPTSDQLMVSRQNSFLAHGVPMQNNYAAAEAAEYAYMEQNAAAVAAVAESRSPGGVVVEACWQMLTPSILRSPTFLLLTVSSMLTMFGFLVPNTLLVDYASSLGHSTDRAALLITYLGIANTFGRICTVFYITHVLNKEKPLFGSLSLNNFTLVLAGVITILLPWSDKVTDDSYGLLVAYAVIYGFSIAVFVSMRGFIVDEMLGAACLTNAFGYLLLFQGLAVIMGPPLFGWLVDQSKVYQDAFVLGGAAVLLSGLLLLPLRRLALWEKRRASAAHCEEFEVASAVTATCEAGLAGAYTPTGGGAGYEAVPCIAAASGGGVQQQLQQLKQQLQHEQQQQQQAPTTPTPL